jgi:predicted nuclease of predicted toxin-antitoxin system
VKLLFDENLSFRLVSALADIYPDSAHVRDLGLLGAEDGAIWSYAAEHGFLLTSKDTDFYERSVLFGAPPKVIWLRIGNRPVATTAEIIRSQYIRIRRFHEDPLATFLPVRTT